VLAAAAAAVAAACAVGQQGLQADCHAAALVPVRSAAAAPLEVRGK
jgi:hypothetical protein